MADAQAIPQNLFSYSDQTTQANTDLQTWITSILGPAVRLYQETALDLGNNITGLTAPGTGSIDVDSRNALSKIWDTDKQVHAVGQAFQDAGDTGAGTIAYVPDSVITTRLANEQLIQAGKQLAQYVQKHGIDSYVWQQLKANENNPYYTAAFFNGLTPDQLSALYDSTSQGTSEMLVLATALANAYATGLLSTSVKDNVKQWLKLLPQSEFYTDFMTALAKDPQAALHFIDTLSGTEMRDFAAGLDTRTDTSEPVNYPVMFMAVCAAAMSSVNDHDPAAAQALLMRVYNAFQGTIPKDMTDMTSEASTLLQTFYAKSLGIPRTFDKGGDPYHNGQRLRDWIDQELTGPNGPITDALLFTQWIVNANGAQDAATTFGRQLSEGAFLSALLAFLPAAPGAAAVVTVAMLESVVSGWVVAGGDATLFPNTAPDEWTAAMKLYCQQAGYECMLITAQYLNAGQLLYDAGGGKLVPLTAEVAHCDTKEDLLKWIMNNQGMVVVKGTNETIADVVDRINNDYFSVWKTNNK